MTKAVKGALLSALSFQALGRIALKRHQRGVVLMLTVLAGLAVMVVNAARPAVWIFEPIESG